MSQPMAILATTRPLTFLGVTTRVSTKTNPPRTYNIAKFADAEIFENFDFFLSDQQFAMVNGLVLHSLVDVTFDLTTRDGRPGINLNSISVRKMSVPVGTK